MRHAPVITLLSTLAACGAGPGAPAATQPAATAGTLTGLIRNANTGEPLATTRVAALREPDNALPTTPEDPRVATVERDLVHADLQTQSAADGVYALSLPIGTYRVIASFQGKQLELDHVAILGGRTRSLDISIDLTTTAPQVVDVRALGPAPPQRFRRARPSSHGVIEGTVTDVGTTERVPGAVVVATSPVTEHTLHTVSDEVGRFELEDLSPGMYTLSIYYHVVHRGNIEVRQSNIEVAAAETTVVEMVLDSRGPR